MCLFFSQSCRCHSECFLRYCMLTLVSFQLTDPWGKGADQGFQHRNQETGCGSHLNAKVPHQCHFPKEMNISPDSLFINHHDPWIRPGFLGVVVALGRVFVITLRFVWCICPSGWYWVETRCWWFCEIFSGIHTGKLTVWTPKWTLGRWLSFSSVGDS